MGSDVELANGGKRVRFSETWRLFTAPQNRPADTASESHENFAIKLPVPVPTYENEEAVHKLLEENSAA